MTFFCIHSFSDWGNIEKFLRKRVENAHYTYLTERHSFLWKWRAAKKIRKADFIIFFVGRHSYTSKNVEWELKKAIQYNKRIYAVPIERYTHIPFTIHYEKKAITVDEIEMIIQDEINRDSNKIEQILFNKNIDTSSEDAKKIMFEEYKLLLQTSEALILRRQTMNTFFLTANGILLSIYGAKYGIQANSKYQFLITLVGILLCLSWKKIISSYGQLNSGKFAVLNKIEKTLPLAIFSAEWIALGEGKDPKKYNSFTDSEKATPKLFLYLYILISIYIIAISLWDVLRSSAFAFNFTHSIFSSFSSISCFFLPLI